LWRLPPARVTLALKDRKVLRGNLVSLVTQVYLAPQEFLAPPVTLVAQVHLVNPVHLAKPVHLANPVMRVQMALTERRA
tara:strand:- start:134 stop:370 length:237 start_codon:yes stop_codon:yes gene_type:complete